MQAPAAERDPDLLLAQLTRDIARGLRLPLVRIATADGRTSTFGGSDGGGGDVSRLPLVTEGSSQVN